MKPRTTLQTNTIGEFLVLFMYRYCYTHKQVAFKISMHEKTFSNRIKTNEWHPGEIRALNNRVLNNYNLKL